MVNGSTDFWDDGMPIGEIEGCGIGRERRRNAVLEITEAKVV